MLALRWAPSAKTEAVRHRCHLSHPFQVAEASAPPQPDLSLRAITSAKNPQWRDKWLGFSCLTTFCKGPCFPVTGVPGKGVLGADKQKQLCPCPSSATD